jgi:hypothetical protein
VEERWAAESSRRNGADQTGSDGVGGLGNAADEKIPRAHEIEMQAVMRDAARKASPNQGLWEKNGSVMQGKTYHLFLSSALQSIADACLCFSVCL